MIYNYMYTWARVKVAVFSVCQHGLALGRLPGDSFPESTHPSPLAYVTGLGTLAPSSPACVRTFYNGKEVDGILKGIAISTLNMCGYALLLIMEDRIYQL